MGFTLSSYHPLLHHGDERGLKAVDAVLARMRHDLDDLRENRKGLLEFGLRTICRGGGMADAADLKSVVRKDVRVRLPPSAPFIHSESHPSH